MKTNAGSTGTGKRHSLHRRSHVSRPVRVAAVFAVLAIVTTTATRHNIAIGHAIVVAATVATTPDIVQWHWRQQ